MRGPRPARVSPASPGRGHLGRAESSLGTDDDALRRLHLRQPCTGVPLVEQDRSGGERVPERHRLADGRHDPPLRLLGRLPRDRPQPLQLPRRDLAGDAALGDDELEGGDADLGRVLHDLLQRVALQERLHDGQPVPRLAGHHRPLLHHALGAVQPAEGLRPVAGQQDQPIAVGHAQHAANLPLDRGRQREAIAIQRVRGDEEAMQRHAGRSSRNETHSPSTRRSATREARGAHRVLHLGCARLDDPARQQRATRRQVCGKRPCQLDQDGRHQVGEDERVALVGSGRQRALACLESIGESVALRVLARGRHRQRIGVDPDRAGRRRAGAPPAPGSRSRSRRRGRDPASARRPAAARGSRGWSDAGRSRTPSPDPG